METPMNTFTITTASPPATIGCTCAALPGIDGVWFGPCGDGRNHRPWCPIARRAMTAAKWPCGKIRFPELSAQDSP
jgi:hypothetical protein